MSDQAQRPWSDTGINPMPGQPASGAQGGLPQGAAPGQPQAGASAGEQAGGPAQYAAGGMGTRSAQPQQPGAMYGAAAAQPGNAPATPGAAAYGGIGASYMDSRAAIQAGAPGGAPAQGQAFAPTAAHPPTAYAPGGYHSAGMLPVAPGPAQMAAAAPGAGMTGSAAYGMAYHAVPVAQPAYGYAATAYPGIHPGAGVAAAPTPAQATMPAMGAAHAGIGQMGIGMAPGQAPAAPAGRGQQAGMAEVLEELSNGGNGLASLGRMLNFEDSEFWKGALVGAAAVLLLTNETVQDTLFKAGAKAKDAVRSGADKLKDAADDIADKAKS